MQVTFTIDGEIYEFSNVDDALCREMNGDWCVKIDGVVEYVGKDKPEFRMQSE